MAFTGQLATVDSMPGNIELGGPVALTAVPRYPKIVAEVNWDSNPTLEFPPSGYTDISNRVRGFLVRRGRNNFVDRVEAGTASLLLDNRDGYFNFTQAGRLLMRKVRLRAFYDNQFFPLIVGHVESYRYSYPGVDKDAVCEIQIADGLKVLAEQQFRTDYVRENETTSGRVASALTEAGIGASFQSIVNTSASQLAPVRVTQPEPLPSQSIAATLTNLSSTIAVADTAGIVPGTEVRAPGIPEGCTVDTITSSTQFTIRNDKNGAAYAKAFLSRTKDTQYPGNPGPWYEIAGISDTKDLSVGMAVGDYNNINGNLLFNDTVHFVTEVESTNTVKVGAAITFTWRGPTDLGGYATGVPFSAPSAATIIVPRIYLDVAGILDHIRQIEATERGMFLVLGDGTYQYQGVDYRATQPVQLTFGESGSEVPYMETQIHFDDTNVRNEYRLKNVYNNTVTIVSDVTSQTNYFKRSEEIEQLFYTNITSLPTSQRLFQPKPRMEGLRPQPAMDPLTLWPKLLNLAISNKVSVRRRPLGGSDIFASYDQFVEGIEHDADPGEWRIRFITSPV